MARPSAWHRVFLWCVGLIDEYQQLETDQSQTILDGLELPSRR
jgi:hypothetical protein